MINVMASLRVIYLIFAEMNLPYLQITDLLRSVTFLLLE